MLLPIGSVFEKLQSLVDQLQITVQKTYIQYQIEILSSAISPTTPLKTSILPPSSSSQPTQPIVVPIHHSPIVMVRFAPLVLPGRLAALPQTYG